MRISCTWSSGMETILGEASAVGAFSFSACFLLEYQMAPPSAAKRTTATSSPFGFMAYLLFHQVASPNMTTPKGKMTTLSQNRVTSFCWVMLSGRSSGALGRMEIKSSSEASQLMVLRNRSRLPREREPAKLLADQREVPTTTKRPGVEPERVPAAARVKGPFLPCLGSMAPPGGTLST